MKKALLHPAWAPAFVLLLAAVPAAFGRDDQDPAPSPDDLVKQLTASDNNAFQAAMQLDGLLRGGNKAAEETAGKVLAVKDQLVQDKDVLALLADDLAKKPVLAARLVLQIVRSQKIVANYKKGNVVVGRLVVEDGKADPELVMAQMLILPEGYFAGEVGDLKRPICFRSNGYEALDAPLEGTKGDVVYLGKVVLKPVKKDDQATLKGAIALDASKAPENAVVTLSISVGPVNTPHNGYSPRSRWPEGIKAAVGKDGSFTVPGLSPAEYQVQVTADNHVAHAASFSLRPGEEKDAGTIRLRCADVGFYIGKPAPKTDKLVWEKDYKTALKRAQEEKKPLFIMMTATWCGWCKKLEADTLDDPWVRSFLSGYVLVQAFEDKEVEDKYGSGGYPTLVFADSDGKLIHKFVGYRAVLPFLEQLVAADKKLGKPLPDELQTLVDKKVVTTGGE